MFHISLLHNQSTTLVKERFLQSTTLSEEFSSNGCCISGGIAEAKGDKHAFFFTDSTLVITNKDSLYEKWEDYLLNDWHRSVFYLVSYWFQIYLAVAPTHSHICIEIQICKYAPIWTLNANYGFVWQSAAEPPLLGSLNFVSLPRWVSAWVLQCGNIY